MALKTIIRIAIHNRPNAMSAIPKPLTITLYIKASSVYLMFPDTYREYANQLRLQLGDRPHQQHPQGRPPPVDQFENPPG
jgi:hypothetical protein